MEPFIEWLEKRVTRPLPGYEAQQKMMNINRPRINEAPVDARESGVLILLFPGADQNIHTVVIERTKDGGAHSGQIALPGGKKEPFDTDIVETALREAREEVALDAGSVRVLGLLSGLYIPVSNFKVQPVIAYSKNLPELTASDSEVARIITLSLEHLFGHKEEVDVVASGGSVNFKIHTIAYVPKPGLVMWGATAMIFSELEHLWNEYNQTRQEH